MRDGVQLDFDLDSTVESVVEVRRLHGNPLPNHKMLHLILSQCRCSYTVRQRVKFEDSLAFNVRLKMKPPKLRTGKRRHPTIPGTVVVYPDKCRSRCHEGGGKPPTLIPELSAKPLVIPTKSMARDSLNFLTWHEPILGDGIVASEENPSSRLAVTLIRHAGPDP